MKIYIITHGEYSDYQIDTVFSNRAAAEKFCAIHNNTGDRYGYPYEIEEYEMDEVKIEGDIKVYYKYRFEIYSSGKIVCTDITYVTTYTPPKITEYANTEQTISITLEEDNEEKAKKIACDELAKHKAEKLLLEF